MASTAKHEAVTKRRKQVAGVKVNAGKMPTVSSAGKVYNSAYQWSVFLLSVKKAKKNSISFRVFKLRRK